MLYTVLPVQRSRSPGAPLELREVHQGDRWLRVEVQGRGEGVIRSILSSNPKDYLNPTLQPGTRVKLADLGIN